LEVQKTEDGSPVITIRGDAKGVSVVAGLVPATSRMGNEKSRRQKTEVQSLQKEGGRARRSNKAAGGRHKTGHYTNTKSAPVL